MLHRFRFSGSNAPRGSRGNGATDRSSDPDLYEHISLAISVRGWCVTPGRLSPVHVAQLGHEVEGLRPEGLPPCGRRPRGRPQAPAAGARPAARPFGRHRPAERPYLATLDGLRQALNEMLLLGLCGFEGHLAAYASGFHRRRLDQFGGVELRRLDGLPRQATHPGIESTPPNDTDGLRQPSGSGARGNLLAPHGAGPLPGERCAKTPGLTIRECVPALLPVEPIPLGEVAAQIGPLPLGPRPGAEGIQPAIVMPA
jgi:hypothetical protein